MIPSVHAKKLAAAVLSLALLAACGGDDGGDETAPDAADTSTTADDGAAAAEEALQDRLLTPTDLATGNDLDAGWEVGDVSAGVDIELPACVVEAVDGAAAAGASTKLVTKNDFKLPSIEEYVGTYDAGAATAAFEAAAARLDACQPEFVYQGTPSMGAIERLPLTLPGEHSGAWRTTVTIAGAGVSITNVHLVQGDLEVALVHVDLGTPDPALLESIVATAAAKLG